MSFLRYNKIIRGSTPGKSQENEFQSCDLRSDRSLQVPINNYNLFNSYDMRQLPEMSSHENLFASNTRQQERFSHPLEESFLAAEIFVRTQLASVTNNNPTFLSPNLLEKLRRSYEQNMSNISNMSNEFDTLRAIACETNRQIPDLYNANLYNAPFSQPQFCPPTISPPILATTQATSSSAYPWFNNSINSSINTSVNTSVNSQDNTNIEINKNVSINYANINNNDNNESDSNEKPKEADSKQKKKKSKRNRDSLRSEKKSSRGRTKKKNKEFKCLRCLKSFGYKHVLQNHERTHTGEKPFKCKQCHKRFTRDHHLKTHIRLHTGEKPYGCDHCERRFVQVANLRRHLRVHTGERPYKCTICSAKFSDSNQLKTHRQTHGCKTYKCAHCHLEFKKQQLLKKHKCGNFLAAPSTSQSQSDLSPQPSDELNDIEISSIDEQSEKSLVESNQSFAHELPNITDAVSAMSILPEQTEPEDLSMSTGMLKSQYSNSNDSFTSSRSFSE